MPSLNVQRSKGSPCCRGVGVPTSPRSPSPCTPTSKRSFGGHEKTHTDRRIWSLDTPERAVKRSPATPPAAFSMQRPLQEEVLLAVAQQSVELLALALMRGHPCAEDHCLFDAVGCQSPQAVELLLRAEWEDVDAPCHGRRPLDAAIELCSVEGDAGHLMSKMLLEHGASPDASGPDSTESPLLRAAKKGSIAGMEILLAHGADPGALDSSGLAPLHVICSQASLFGAAYTRRLVGTMLRGGADPLRRDAFGREPVHHLEGDSQEIRELLVRTGWQRRRLSLRLLAGSAAGKGPASAESAGWTPGWGTLLPELAEDIIGFL